MPYDNLLAILQIDSRWRIQFSGMAVVISNARQLGWRQGLPPLAYIAGSTMRWFWQQYLPHLGLVAGSTTTGIGNSVHHAWYWQQGLPCLVLVAGSTTLGSGSRVNNTVLQCQQKAICESTPGYLHSDVVDVFRQCMSALLMLGFKLDYSSCANWDSFCKPVTYLNKILTMNVGSQPH